MQSIESIQVFPGSVIVVVTLLSVNDAGLVNAAIAAGNVSIATNGKTVSASLLSAPPTPAPTQPDSSGSSTTSAANNGITAAIIVAVAVLSIIAFTVYRRQQHRDSQASSSGFAEKQDKRGEALANAHYDGRKGSPRRQSEVCISGSHPYETLQTISERTGVTEPVYSAGPPMNINCTPHEQRPATRGHTHFQPKPVEQGEQSFVREQNGNRRISSLRVPEGPTRSIQTTDEAELDSHYEV